MPSITRRSGPRPAGALSAEAEVLAATRRLLAGGATFTELGVQRICAEAGVARSTFYSHFTDKTDLVVRLFGSMVDASYDIVSPWTPADGPEALAESFGEVIGLYREYADVLRAVAEVAAYDATVREIWDTRVARFTEHNTALL